MISIELSAQIQRTAKKMSPEIRAKANAAIQGMARNFGKPHAHAGLGLRKLGSRSYEVRVDLKWRIVFLHEEDRLIAFDIMNHDEVRRWTRNQGK